jgi:hypothetical protein
MIDLQKVKEDYEKLKKQSVSRLLPFEKVVLLEKSKQFIIEKYLKNITKINLNFEIESVTGFKMDDIIKVAKTFFGDLNFYDTGNEENKLTIDMAFHFCIISLSFTNDKMKYKVTVFWDL